MPAHKHTLNTPQGHAASVWKRSFVTHSVDISTNYALHLAFLLAILLTNKQINYLSSFLGVFGDWERIQGSCKDNAASSLLLWARQSASLWLGPFPLKFFVNLLWWATFCSIQQRIYQKKALKYCKLPGIFKSDLEFLWSKVKMQQIFLLSIYCIVMERQNFWNHSIMSGHSFDHLK